MDEQTNEAPGQGEQPPVPSPPPPPPPSETAGTQSQSQEGRGEEDEEETKNEEDELIAKAHKLMEKITASPDNPNPTVLHALASVLETQESRFVLLVILLVLIRFVKVLVFKTEFLTL